MLTAIASMAQQRKGMFEPYLKAFYVEHSDPKFVRLIKLEILTTLANESNISAILREFQEYVKHPDRDFVTQTIQCLGRCASTLSNVTESCLTGLLALMRNKDGRQTAISDECDITYRGCRCRKRRCNKEAFTTESRIS